MKLAISGRLRLPTLPHPKRNVRIYDRVWMRAWLLPIPRLMR